MTALSADAFTITPGQSNLDVGLRIVVPRPAAPPSVFQDFVRARMAMNDLRADELERQILSSLDSESLVKWAVQLARDEDNEEYLRYAAALLLQGGRGSSRGLQAAAARPGNEAQHFLRAAAQLCDVPGAARATLLANFARHPDDSVAEAVLEEALSMEPTCRLFVLRVLAERSAEGVRDDARRILAHYEGPGG